MRTHDGQRLHKDKNERDLRRESRRHMKMCRNKTNLNQGQRSAVDLDDALAFLAVTDSHLRNEMFTLKLRRKKENKKLTAFFFLPKH
jgi:hypothetical protein